MTVTNLVSKLNLPKWLLAILVLVFILRVPSFFEPYYYGDEMIYLTLGQGVRQGLTLYKEIYDNKPPLLYLTAAIAGNLFWFKAILALFSMLTVTLFYKLSVRLFNKNLNIQKFSTTVFALLTSLPLLEGNTVNSELFMIGFTLMAMLILLKEKLKSSDLFLGGIMFGIGTLYKIPAAFDVPVIIAFWIITNNFKNLGTLIKNTVILGLGFITPIALTFVYYTVVGAQGEYLRAAFLQNVGYLSSFRPEDVQKPFYIKNAPLLLRAFGVSLISVSLFLFRKRLSRNFILLSLWIAFGLFAVTLSERPYPHYLVQIISPVAFLVGMLYADRTIEQSLTVLPLFLVFFVPVYYKFYYYPTTQYYLRFINFAIGKTDKFTYFREFSDKVTRNYEIANFLATSARPTDKVFMWDPDSAIVYALSRRLPPIKYVADYHINDFTTKSSVASEIAKNPPKFIILTSGNRFTELGGLIKSRYLLITQIQNANIYSRIDYTLQRGN